MERMAYALYRQHRKDPNPNAFVSITGPGRGRGTRKLPKSCKGHSLPVAELDIFKVPQLIDCMETTGPLSPTKEFRPA